MKNKLSKGFTLVELIVVMAIISILVTLIASGFRTVQMKGRDAKRKSDLKQVANSLELFYNDHGKYPDSSAGVIVGCPWSATSTPTNCNWDGNSEFTDGKTAYFRQLPKDPINSQEYYYRIVPNSQNKKFQIFARLENDQDRDCINSNCATPGVAYSCGLGYTCNFAVTSGNTTPTE